MSTDNAEQDDVAGHFQLPGETFDDDAVASSHQHLAAQPAVHSAEDTDDVVGHVRTDPNAVEDAGDVDGHHVTTV